MGKEFSAHLEGLRRQAGFKTAYQFFHGNGGRRHFPFTYVHYLRMERRGRLPRPQWLGLMLTALRLSPGSAACRKLFLLYLRDLLETEEAFDTVVAPLLAKAAEPAGALGYSMRLVKESHVVHLTPAQFRVISGDEATYWCSEALFNDSGAWTAADLSAKLGLPAPKVAAGLERLRKAGLARLSAGRYKSRWAGKLYTFPGRLQDMKASLDKVQGYWESMFKRRGRGIAERVELIRAEEGFVRGHLASLAEAMDAANLGATHSAGERTGLYLFEARVRELLPF